MTEDPCAAENCLIDDSPDSEVLWVCCNKCKQWYHPVCIGLKSLPESDYFCLVCAQKKAPANPTERIKKN